MEYCVLGPLRAGEGPQPIRGQRARDVLTLLLLRRGRPLPAEVVLDAVWDTEAPRFDASVVHTVIARLRRALGTEAIDRQDAGYHLAADARVDADEFSRMVSDAGRCGSERRAEAVALLRRALALWSGPEAYGGTSETLVATERPRLHELRDNAIEQLAERLLTVGEPRELDESVALTQALAAREPLRERAHELLMEALYRLGRQGEALAAYDRLRRDLRDELGIDPSRAVAAMHARILAHEISTPTPRTALGRSVIPRPRTPTVGRAQELEALTEFARSPRRLITILGPGGVGKSRLLEEFAAQLPTEHSVVYAELPTVPGASLTEVAETVACAARVTVGGRGDPVAALCRSLSSRHALILLDEAEWTLTASARLVDTLLTRCPGLRFVVTSRVPLGLVGESRLVVGPLPVPLCGDDDEAVRTCPAVRLFVDRLGDYAPDLQLTAADYQRVAEITRRVDGLPLALEIVAGQATSSSVADLLELVDAPLDIAAAEGDRHTRHRTLRETLAWSMHRLPADAQTVLARLAVFAGPFDMAAAEAIAGHVGEVRVPALVRLLIRESHLQVDRRDGVVRMRMLRTVQGLAREHLRGSGGEANTLARYRTWYATRWRGHVLSDALVTDVSSFYPDYLAALRSSLANRDAETLGDLAIVLSRYWFFVESGSEGVQLVRGALASGVLSEHHAAILRLLEVALLPQDQGAEQRAVLDDLAPALADDPDWLGRLHILRSVGPYVHGEFALALECATEAVAVARERAPHHLPEALGAYAVMLAAVDRPMAAVEAAQAAWQLIGAAPSAVELTQVVPKIALALIDSDHPREALTVLDRAISRVESELGLPPPSLFTTNAGWAALGSGEPRVALWRFAQSLDQLVGGGDLLVAGEVLSGAGAAMAALGCADARDILDLAETSLRSASAVLSPWQQATVARYRDALPDRADPLLPQLDVAHGMALIRRATDQRPSRPATGPTRSGALTGS